MYFFDLQDYIGTIKATYPAWEEVSILYGGMGLGAWRGLVNSDPEDYFTTARATGDSFIKALGLYLKRCVYISHNSWQPENSTISKLYYNDFTYATQRYLETSRPYQNAIRANKRYYDNKVIQGYTGTYDDWLFNEINGIHEDVLTGTTTVTTNKVVYVPNVSPGNSIIPVTYTLNYGSFEEIKNVDKYYNEFKASMDDLMRVMKTAMVLTDNDEFEDLEPEITPLSTNCGSEYTPPMFTDAMQLDFMDDLTRMPSFENIIAMPYTSGTIDYSSSAALRNKSDEYGDLSYDIYYRQEREDIYNLEYDIATGITMGFPIESYPTLNYSGLTEPLFDSNKLGNYVKGKIRKVANLWWKKAYTYSAWTSTTYTTHNKTLDEILPNVEDFRYLRAKLNPSTLPKSGNAGDLICVGTPTSYVGYAWDPILKTWSTNFYDFIKTTILDTRTTQRDIKLYAKKQLLSANKPFLWSNEYVASNGLKQWVYGDAKNFDPGNRTGADVIYNYNNGLPLGLPPEYVVTATTHTIPAYTGNSDNIIY
jgi:hypothetical protein